MPLESAIIIVSAGVVGFTSFLAAHYNLLSQLPATTPPAVKEAIERAVSVMDGGRMTGYGIAGAIAGALVAICFMDSPNYKVMARKLVASTLSSVLFSAKVMEWLGWQPTDTNILFAFGGFALIAWSIIQVVLAKAGPYFTSWLALKAPQPPSSNNP